MGGDASIPIGIALAVLVVLAGVVRWVIAKLDEIRRDHVAQDEYDKDLRRIEERLKALGDRSHDHAEEIQRLIARSEMPPTRPRRGGNE